MSAISLPELDGIKIEDENIAQLSQGLLTDKLGFSIKRRYKMSQSMFNLIQTHHGISCSDIDATKKVLRAIGFSDTQPGAPEPLVFKNEKGDHIGQLTAAVLGDEYHTHYVENPETRHQIDLIEIQEAALVPRPCGPPAQGDLIIAFSSADPLKTYRAMVANDHPANFSDPVDVPGEDGIQFVWRDGQHSMITTQDSPFAIVHYNLEDFPRVRKFYEYVLEIPVVEVDVNNDGSGRYQLFGIGGRMDLEVRPDIKRLDLRAWGKHYPAANHFRLIERDIERISARLEETGLGGWVIPPEGPFAFIFGPTSETIETFDKSFAVMMAGTS